MIDNGEMRLELVPFETRCSLKAQAKKVLEEAAELFNEAEIRTKHPDLENHLSWLEDEAADVIMATVNLVWLAWRKEEGEFGLADLEDTMAWAMERCRQRNEDRGRYPR